jgi:hypothetical protein
MSHRFARSIAAWSSHGQMSAGGLHGLWKSQFFMGLYFRLEMGSVIHER